MTDVLLQLATVSKSYRGVPAVSDVDLEVRAGERLAIIGPNGAGKSTLFGMMAGEHRPTSGRVLFGGRDVTGWVPSRRSTAGISRTFQVARLFDSMSVRENMMVAALSARRRPHAWDAFSRHRRAEKTVDELLAQTGLEALADSGTATLAQGARKSLELIMAIAQEPRVLLLDEPTAGMSYDDARSAVTLLNELLDARPELTIVLTAHDMDVIHRVARRVVLMARGRVVLEGTPAEVAAHETTRELYLGRQKGTVQA
ncbi:amino acid/amide ABC transporter ATP-binding protein 1 (HAAT family) [Jatrophihabitans sp. GAS493]|uniref:ABC transporter ATP-binding protein n=1 Tax=Jatrophihabitans sp. GAS493 TaxID=1907575 RepID=UPI000BB92D99|nr:ABC transporter ATP-binding protein [Jatrophihabitans sp. GAS493]SOD74666.1 amino acid/amide ABC transporter ATP-binding protein 1 (HAAT family) [Jatrophihabitans sp. GAS493]